MLFIIKNYYVYYFPLSYWVTYSDLSIKNNQCWFSMVFPLSLYHPFFLPFAGNSKTTTLRVYLNSLLGIILNFMVVQFFKIYISLSLLKQGICSFSVDLTSMNIEKICISTTSQKVPEPYTS